MNGRDDVKGWTGHRSSIIMPDTYSKDHPYRLAVWYHGPGYSFCVGDDARTVMRNHPRDGRSLLESLRIPPY